MDLVLGLSVTSTAVRWVLVEGTTGEGAPIDRGALDITEDAPFDADGLLSVLLDANESVVECGVHAVGVTWTTDADAAALAVLDALDARGLENVVSVSEIEAAEALAGGIADIAGYDDVAVCIFEPDATLVCGGQRRRSDRRPPGSARRRCGQHRADQQCDRAGPQRSAARTRFSSSVRPNSIRSCRRSTRSRRHR